MNKIKLSLEQAATLLKGLQAQPGTIIGEHLSDEEFIAYEMETLTPDEQTRIDTHLDSCEECSERMDLLVTAAEEWRTRDGRARLQQLRSRLLAQEPGFWTRLQERLAALFLLPNVKLAPVLAHETTPWQGGELAGGALYWRVETRPNEDLRIHVGSFVLPAGTRVRVRAGDWQDEAELRPIASDQVGASVTLTAATRRAFPSDTPLQVTLAGDASANL